MSFNEQALDRVKIGAFLRRGIPIRGIIHVGASDGYEIDWYLKLGIQHVFAVEPELTAFKKLRQKFQHVSGVLLYCGALGDKGGDGMLRVPPENTGGSTLLAELPIGPSITGVTYSYSGKQETLVMPLEMMAAMLPLFKAEDYNCLVVDVQGMEMQVLQGFGSCLDEMDCLNIECSRVPIYEGEAPAHEVVEWLAEHGFEPITPIEAHDDILFVRQGK